MAPGSYCRELPRRLSCASRRSWSLLQDDRPNHRLEKSSRVPGTSPATAALSRANPPSEARRSRVPLSCRDLHGGCDGRATCDHPSGVPSERWARPADDRSNALELSPPQYGERSEPPFDGGLHLDRQHDPLPSRHARVQLRERDHVLEFLERHHSGGRRIEPVHWTHQHRIERRSDHVDGSECRNRERHRRDHDRRGGARCPRNQPDLSSWVLQRNRAGRDLRGGM